MFSTWRLALARIGRWPRVLAAGACALLSVLSALNSSAAARPARTAGTVPVVVAVAALPAGHVLAPRDLRVARWPAHLVPVGTAGSVRTVGHRRLAGPVAAGEPITATRLVGAGLARGLPVGWEALPVPLADVHAAEVIRAGDRIDLLASPDPDLDGGSSANPTQVGVVASDVAVLAVFAGSDGASGEVIVAVDRATALGIIRHETGATLTAGPV